MPGPGARRGQSPLYLAAGLLGLGFVISFATQDRLNAYVRRYTALFDINAEGLARLDRAWDRLPAPQDALSVTRAAVGTARRSPAARHAESEQTGTGNGKVDADTGGIDAATAFDLDLIGQASLEHLLNSPNTPAGRAALRQWILAPADPAEIDLRQAAVAELGPQIDFRDKVGAQGRLMGALQTPYERLIAWAEDEPWLGRRPWLLWLARLLLLLTFGLGLALAAHQVDVLVLEVVLAADATLTLLTFRQVGEQIERVAEQQRIFGAYAEMFELIERQNFNAPGLVRLQERLAASQLDAGGQMRRLSRLMPLVEIRRFMFFFIFEIPTLWSVHILWLLERWQRDNGPSLSAWLLTLGEVEALLALSALHHDHPDWAFPEVVGLPEASGLTVTARGLAHPLLPPARAVTNDITIGPPGTFLLVTGSNMSGKSTLLRAIGVNAVLAQMGGPACAAALRLPPLTVASSIRVHDSLREGVSTFMAELRRLKAVVDIVDQAREANASVPVSRAVLYLLDEILQGTNTAERQVAARRIIAHLLRSGTSRGGSIGAVSTHDLTLAEDPSLQKAAVAVHFTETFTHTTAGPSMSFDYRLRPGIATSTNALKLMEIVGLMEE